MRKVCKIKNRDVQIEAPPSKAYTLRTLIIASLAEGQSTINRPLLGQDQLNVIACLKDLGIEIQTQKDKIIVNGLGGKYKPQGEELNVGESGVGMNFLTSAACLADKPVVLTGAKRITERPIEEIVNGLRQLGCEIDCLQNEGYPPIRITPVGIKGGRCEMSGAKSSQYFSSMVISAALAQSPVTVICTDDMTEKPYLDITLHMMERFGIKPENRDYKKIDVPVGKYKGHAIRIEGDYSSASYFFLAAAICGSKVTVGNMNPDTKQGDSAFINLMEKMGCEVNRDGETVIIRGKSLKPIEQDMSDMPDMVPSMAIACAFADGTSRLTNIAHLRHKECDRLAVVAEELAKMGVACKVDADSLSIIGNRKAHGARINSHNDHRIAMSFAVAGLATGEQIIDDPGCVAKSFPDFWERFEVFVK